MLHDGELRKPGGLEVAGITFVLHLRPTQKLGRVQKPVKTSSLQVFRLTEEH